MEDISFRHIAGVTLLAWLGVIGFDFFLHASLLAPLYAQPSSFLLAPERAFALIPLGYLSFLVIVTLIAWLMLKLEITTLQAGLVFGLELGALLWGGLILSLVSISTAPLQLMVGWFLGQTIETGFAGLIIAEGLGAANLRSLTAWVLLFVLVAFLLGILIQNL
ncbi:MAG: hypothetical protein ACWGOY_05880 [Anaerolineales bacterium]